MERFWVFIEKKWQGPYDLAALRFVPGFTLGTPVCPVSDLMRSAEEIPHIRQALMRGPHADALEAMDPADKCKLESNLRCALALVDPSLMPRLLPAPVASRKVVNRKWVLPAEKAESDFSAPLVAAVCVVSFMIGGGIYWYATRPIPPSVSRAPLQIVSQKGVPSAATPVVRPAALTQAKVVEKKAPSKTPQKTLARITHAIESIVANPKKRKPSSPPEVAAKPVAKPVHMMDDDFDSDIASLDYFRRK